MNAEESIEKTENLCLYIDSQKREKLKSLLISVIIPLYNEENTIRNVIERIPNHQRYEIIIVDDGSTDNGVEKVRQIKNREIKIIKHETNKGYGAAILSGLKYATGNIVVTLDSDGQHNPEEIPTLISPILKKQADITVGSRYLGKSNYKVPLYTRIGEYFISTSLRFLFRQKVCNNQSGFRGFSSNSLKIFRNMKHITFGFCTETLFEAAYNRLRISEIPVNINVRKYGKSHIRIFKILIAISSCILTYLVKRFRLNRFISDQNFAKLKREITLLIRKFT
ncbi:MAG: glycosyltransferase family 2 protein [Promethearchaeota archaeon]